MFGLLAGVATKRPVVLLSVAAIILLTAGVYGSQVADKLDPYSVVDPASQGAEVERRLKRATGFDPKIGVVALIDLDAPIGTATARAKVREVALAIGTDPAIAQVITYYAAREPAMVSRDRRATIVVANLKPLSDRDQERAARRLLAHFADDPKVHLGGYTIGFAQVATTVSKDLHRAELIAVPILFILALLIFRGLIAAALPLAIGVASTILTNAVLRALTHATSITVFVLNLVTGLGLGLAIDYGLLIVTRYREELTRHGPGIVAIGNTLNSAGRTVFFSCLTVAGALACLLVFPQRFLYSMGIGGIIVAISSGLVALTVLPALLHLLGERVNAFAVPARRIRPKHTSENAGPVLGDVTGGRPGLGLESDAGSDGHWYRLARLVMRRPLTIATVATVALVAFGLPFTGVRFTAVDGGVLPRDQSTRQVHDRMIGEFPPYRTLPMFVLASQKSRTPPADIAHTLARLQGVARVEVPLKVGHSDVLIKVVSQHPPLSRQSQRLLERVRAVDSEPPLIVGGMTADLADYKHSVSSRLPVAIAIVVVTTLILVFFLTGSVLLPIKTLVLNAVTVSASFGVLVLIFQDGRLEGLLDFESRGAIDASQPVILFALVFGLATDYGVMMLARIKELHEGGASNAEAVSMGLERTGRVITAAAALFCVAVFLFATSSIVFIKELGIGTAIAVLIDATIVRALLVPALMVLFGDWNWWAPKPLARLGAFTTWSR